MRMVAGLLRGIFVIAIGVIASLAIVAALIADARSTTMEQRRRNQTRTPRNLRELGQSNIAMVEEIVS